MEQTIQTQTKKTPRDFFLYLFATVAVYFSAINVIVLLWQYINYFFPDAANRYESYGLSGAMRWSVAALIIVFPAYVLVMRFLGRDIDRNPEKRELRVRKWLLYLTLFIAALTIIGDLVSLVYTFLGGDLAIRFALKALAVLLVAGAVFVYYLFNLRREPGAAVGRRNAIAWIASVVVGAIIIGAFFIVGSPATNRLRKLDQQRVNDLQTIQWQIVSYWQQKQAFPKSLADLNDSISGYVSPKDPESGKDYEYILGEGRSFQLCATFSAKSVAQSDRSIPLPVSEYGVQENWAHDAGRVCFERTIDPQRYPPIPNKF